MLLRRHLVSHLWAATAPSRTSKTLPRCRAQLSNDRGGRGEARQQPSAHQRGAAAQAAVACPEAPLQDQRGLKPVQSRKAAAHEQMFCLVQNEEVVPCGLPSGAWLEASPRGAYTTARTVGGGSSVLELSFHIQRLASSAALMMEADAAAAAAAAAAGKEEETAGAAVPAIPEAADPELLRPRVMAALRAGVRAYRAASGEPDGELKLTVLVSWGGCRHEEQQQDRQQGQQGQQSGVSSNGTAMRAEPPPASGVDIHVHVSPLPPRPAPPVRVVMRGAPRQNAAAKDSEWVRQRRALERGLPPDVNEAVLVGQGGALYEGLTSNFFAVMDGTVYTAGDGVLAGTVREVTLAVARREGIPVVLEPPRLADLPRWEGCFITSTSRLLLPVDEASMFQDPKEEAAGQAAAAAAAGGEAMAGTAAVPTPSSRCFARGGLVTRLEQLVLAEVAACSEPLFE